jgi:DNA-binding protein YbaB
MFDFDPDRFQVEDLHRSEDALSALTEVLAEIQRVTGEGEAADGLIRVVVDSAGRAAGVTVDPRAMRLGSEVLAEGVRDAFNAAQDDLQAKSGRLIAGALPEGVTQEDAGHGQMRGRFEEIAESFDRAMRERQAAFDRIRKDVEDLD